MEETKKARSRMNIYSAKKERKPRGSLPWDRPRLHLLSDEKAKLGHLMGSATRGKKKKHVESGVIRKAFLVNERQPTSLTMPEEMSGNKTNSLRRKRGKKNERWEVYSP